MSPENPVALRVLLGFLRAGRVLEGGSSALLVGTVVLAGAPLPAFGIVGIAAALAAGLLEKYFAWRVALDAEFFALLCEQPAQTEAFDAALAEFLGREITPGRSMESRWRGARRLLKLQAAAVAVQAVAVAALVVLAWGRSPHPPAPSPGERGSLVSIKSEELSSRSKVNGLFVARCQLLVRRLTTY